MYIAKSTNSRELKDALYLRLVSGLDTSTHVLRCLLQCSEKNKIHVFYSVRGLPIAYMAYALISKQTLYMLSTCNQVSIRDYELDEGRILYIMDMVITKDHSRLAGNMIKDEIFKRRLICGKKDGEFRIYNKFNRKFKKVCLSIVENETVEKASLLKRKTLKLVKTKSG